MTPENANQVTVALLMLSLISVLAVAIFASFLGLIYVRRRWPLRLPSSRPPSRPQSGTLRYRPAVFENACRWIVVKGSQVSAVQTALGLHNAVPCSWDEGLAQLTSHKLFISPPVKGWIVVIGPGLPDPSEDVDRCFHLVRKMSRSLGVVQFFGFNRALNHQSWVWVESGQIRRAYCWAGETLWNQGTETPTEKELGLHCLGYGEHPEASDFIGNDSGGSAADKVLSVATGWSFDPTALDQSALGLHQGVRGTWSHSNCIRPTASVRFSLATVSLRRHCRPKANPMTLDAVLDKFPREVNLKGGLTCLQRPLEPEDRQALHQFFLAVPERERMFIKHRVTDPELIGEWCQNIDLGRNFPLLALDKDQIIGVGTLHQQLGGWKRHIGRVSVLVHPQFRGRGLAKELVSECVDVARQMSLEKVEAEFIGEQDAAMKVFALLSFRVLARIADYVKDMQGISHDYVLMGVDLITDEEYAGVGG